MNFVLKRDGIIADKMFMLLSFAVNLFAPLDTQQVAFCWIRPLAYLARYSYWQCNFQVFK